MKRYLYFISLIVLSIGFSSCSKDDEPAPAPAIVGRWDLNHIRTSGFTNAQYNGLMLDTYYLQAYGSRLDVYSDNTFLLNEKQEFNVYDVRGTWQFNNNQITLTFDNGGDSQTYTYTKDGNVEELASTAVDLSLDSAGAVRGKAQLIYRK